MRFAVASVALFAGAALALPGYEQSTVYSTHEVTVTDCGPEVSDCTGGHPTSTDVVDPTGYPSDYPTTTDVVDPTGPYPTGTGVEPIPTDYSTAYVTVTDCPPEVTDCPAHSTYVTSSVYPTGTGVEPTEGYPTEQPPYPTSTPYESTSVVTYTTCVPTVTSSTITYYPTDTPSGTGVPPTGYPTGTGVPPPYPTQSTPPINNGAGSLGFSALAGVAAIVALFA
ncbi:hypothetical protein FQN57_007148 [Myotisia sp. PD_48]|nr:hypothetical protein FQN57_007148 [Myotisia sp. PD_48]